MRARFPLLLALVMSAAGAQAQVTVQVHAAGSLRAPMLAAAAAFESVDPGTRIQAVFGASGLLRDRLLGGEPSDVFASANMEHPRALADRGGWTGLRPFALNALCALAPRKLAFTSGNLVQRLFDPAVRVGTSTPKADPSGDYAFELFRRIGERAGASADARQRLESKALQLTGGPDSPAPPRDRNVYGALVSGGQADVFITYCTNAAIAVKEDPTLERIDIPDDVNVGAEYGIVRRVDAPAAARAFTDFLLSAPGRAILARHGFLPPPP